MPVICERCKKRDAKNFVCQIIDGAQKNLSLCDECFRADQTLSERSDIRRNGAMLLLPGTSEDSPCKRRGRAARPRSALSFYLRPLQSAVCPVHLTGNGGHTCRLECRGANERLC